MFEFVEDAVLITHDGPTVFYFTIKNFSLRDDMIRKHQVQVSETSVPVNYLKLSFLHTIVDFSH